MLELQSLFKSYRGIPAIQDVSFKVAPGEVVGFLGPKAQLRWKRTFQTFWSSKASPSTPWSSTLCKTKRGILNVDSANQSFGRRRGRSLRPRTGTMDGEATLCH